MRQKLCSLVLCLSLLAAGCRRSGEERFQGYVEGEFVNVSSVISGQLVELAVSRGDQVTSQQLLYELDNAAETAVREEAERRFQQARSNLEDLSKGKRPSEIDSIKAQLGQAQAGLELSEKALIRNKRLLQTKAVSEQTFDEAFSQRDRDFQLVQQLKSELETAGLGAREDQLRAAEAEMSARKAELDKAEWEFNQKRAKAVSAALVYDTFFRPGEFVPAGQPVVSLLPPQNIKVRTFIAEPALARLSVGQTAVIFQDGIDSEIQGRLTYISTQAEFTPPVIYSRESRSKLVFMVEISFEPAAAKNLHPGQPVEVSFE